MLAAIVPAIEGERAGKLVVEISNVRVNGNNRAGIGRVDRVEACLEELKPRRGARGTA